MENDRVRAKKASISVTRPSPAQAPQALIQRACDCGGKAGASGSCQDCDREKLTGLQPKLTANGAAPLALNQPGDRFEQEADRVAEAVVRGSAPDFRGSISPVGDFAEVGKASRSVLGAYSHPGAPRSPQPANLNTRYQREPLEEDEEALMAKPLPGTNPTAADNDQTPPSATAPIAGATRDMVEGGLPSVSSLIPGSGRPLDPGTRTFMEPHFGHDFSQVRVHTGPEAEQAAASIHARAFTLGRDIVFGAREYDPGSTTGRRLLAHELTHVVQQGEGFQAGIQRAPTLDASCNDRKDEIEPAVEEAGELAASAVAILEKFMLLSNEKGALDKNFGSPSSEQKKTILKRFKHISTTLDSKEIECNNECPQRNRTLLCAQGEISGNKIIICPRFGSEGCIPGPTILHEAAHNAGAANDIDKGSSYPPADAENNAYSYEYFILDALKGPAPIDLEGKPDAPIFEFDE